MDRETLESILKFEDVINNSELKKNLEKLLYDNQSSSSAYYNPSTVSLDSYKYLLINKYLTSKEIFNQALLLESCEKQDKMLELALENEIDFSSMDSLPSNVLPEVLEKCFKSGLTLRQAAKLVVACYNGADEGLIANQIKLIEYLVEKNANFSEVYYMPAEFNKETYELMLNNGLKAQALLRIAVENIDWELIDLALIYKANLNKIEYLPVLYTSNSSNLFLLNSLVNKGLTVDNAFKLVIEFYSTIFDSENNKYISDNELPDEYNNIKHEIIASFFVGKKVNFDMMINEVQLPNSNYIYNYKEFLLENFGANILLKLLSSASIDSDKKEKLLEFAFKNGAKIESKALDEMLENKMHEFLFSPNKIITQKYKNLDAVRADEAKIPYLMHHIWLTHPKRPQEIRPQDLENAIKTKSTFAKADVKWSHVVWTNDKNLIPESVKILETNGIEVRSIYDYQEDLSLFNLIEGMISDSKWGMASDTLRYVIIEHFGGVYADINFIFNRDVTDEVHKYNFFTKTYESYYVDNFYFGSSQHHPVVQKIIELVEHNMVNPPKYLASINPDSNKFTDSGTANPSYIAYYLEANKNGNIDVVYPLTNDRKNIFKNIRDDLYEDSDRDSNRDSNGSDSIEESLIIQYNPEQIMWINFQKDFYNHEFCGADYYNIGYDSPDGQTWVS